MRLHQSARPARPEQAELRNQFWSAPDDALLDRKTVAAGLSRSTGWLELRATEGDGPPYLKMGTHRVLYRKADVVTWLSRYAKRLTSTSDIRAGGTVAKRVPGADEQPGGAGKLAEQQT